MPIKFLMPALSPTMTEGNIAKWNKKEGDKISAGEVIAEIETDKATMEVEAVDEGILAKIVVPQGTENVAVNSLIAVLVDEDEKDVDVDLFVKEELAKNVKDVDGSRIADASGMTAAPNASGMTGAHSASGMTSASAFQDTSSSSFRDRRYPESIGIPDSYASGMTAAPSASGMTLAPSASGMNKMGRIFASPLAKRIAANEGISLSNISGSGPHGRIIKSDVLNFSQNNKGAILRASQEYNIVPNNNMRKIIAKRLLDSKITVPHFYLSIECFMDQILQMREQINGILIGEEKSKKLSVNDFIILASAKALKDVPKANSSWTNDAILMYNNVDISVAVAIEGGLITPIIKNADQKNIKSISAEMKDLARRAKENLLAPEEFQGGGFTISNLGMYGIKNFSAIINPPQGCIMAVGASSKRPVVVDDKIEIKTIMDVTLSCDHRVVDGAVGAQFLSAFKKYIESPILMFVD